MTGTAVAFTAKASRAAGASGAAPVGLREADMATAGERAGHLLRQWRNQRGLSQLRLALDANVSTRHISFVENGHANPSREMIIHLCDVLDVPLRERNRILQAAGFASVYRHTPLDDPALSQVSRVVDLLLESSHPAGAVALDWGWNVVRANRAMLAVAARFADPALLAEQPPNVMRLLFAEGGLHRFVQNWQELGPVVVGRIRREADYEGHGEAIEILDELLDHPWVAQEWVDRGHEAPAPPLVTMHLKRDELELRLFSTITTLGTPQDVTLQELRIETFHPADETSAGAMRRICEDV